MKKKVVIIGTGFASLSAACYLAKDNFQVQVFEKNESIGGRARQLKANGYTFDMGPSWYWMPDVFERFFQDFKKSPSDYYELQKLNPAYSVTFGEGDKIVIDDTLDEIYQTFEKEEKGSASSLKVFIDKAQSNYQIAIKDLVYRPGVSPMELVTPETISNIGQFFSTISGTVRKNFNSKKLIQILEFPVLFLGARPDHTPAFYSFMNYADFGLGTWHPYGGMFKVVEGIEKLARSLGVEIFTSSPVEKINVIDGKASSVSIDGKEITADYFVSGADYHHSETLLEPKFRQYSEKYWEKKIFAPSSLLFYVGFNKKLTNVNHHNLYFDVDFEAHARDIYDEPQWPEEPLFYANFTSVTDPSTAPENCENGFFLIPLAPGLNDTPGLREEYFEKIIKRFEKLTNQTVKEHIAFKKSFCVKDFIKDYNSYKGNAYGMANTLLQTAFLRPSLKSSKVKGLYFTGQLTVPGPGVPPALISGKLVAGLIQKEQQ